MKTKLFELKPCDECKGTAEAYHLGHDYDCPDCLGTGYEEPAKRIMNLESELIATRTKLNDTLTAMAMLGDKHEQEIAAVTEQRDRLAEALRSLIEFPMIMVECIDGGSEHLSECEKALAAVEGRSHE
jgi:hypothetical protein